MGWPEILSILEAERQLFSPEILGALKDWTRYESRAAAIDAMKFDESGTQRILDRACQQFASKRNWPDIDREQKYWLYGRLTAACDLVNFCVCSKRSKGWVFPAPDKDVSIESILEQILVRYWYFGGREYFLGKLIFGAMGPFDPLAGLPEPPGFPSA